MNKAINIVCVFFCLICAVTTLFNLKALDECKKDIDTLRLISEAHMRINNEFKKFLFD